MAALTALLPPAHISRHLLAPVASILGLGFIAHRIALFLPPPVDQQASTRKFLKGRRRELANLLGLEQINHELGSGTTGLVVSAKAADGLTCALKVIDRGNAAVDLDYLREEISTLRQARSCPNIIDFLGDVTIGNYTILTTLQFGNGTMHSRLAEHGRFNERTALLFFRQLHNALAFLEEHEILHRDVKPKNILLQNGTLQLCDFGVACKLKDGKAVGQVGSLAFAAPEVWQGEPYGKAVDWWSAGVVLYHMLCNQAPFAVLSMNCQRSSRTSFPSKMACPASHVSKEATELLDALMSRDPNERPASVAVARDFAWLSN